MIKHHMYKSQCPKRFWCYCGQWVAAIRRFIAHNIPALEGSNPYERIHARTADISEYVQFDWYQFVWYLDPSQDGIQPTRVIGRWLGVAVDTGSKMCYYVLNDKGNVLKRSSVRPVQPDEMMTDENIARMKEHDETIKRRFGDHLKKHQLARNVDDIEHFEYTLFDDDDDDLVEPVAPELSAQDADASLARSRPDYLNEHTSLESRSRGMLSMPWKLIKRLVRTSGKRQLRKK